MLCDPKQKFAMAGAEEKLKGESRDRQVMSSNANGAEGAEGKMEETNLSSKNRLGLLLPLPPADAPGLSVRHRKFL